MSLLLEGGEAFFLWVVRTSWYAGVFAAAILGVRAVLSHRLPARWREALWALLILRLLLPELPPGRFSLQESVPFPLVESPVGTAMPIEIPADVPAIMEVPVTSTGRRFSLLELAALGWAGGVLLLGGFAMVSYGRFARILHRERESDDPELIALAQACAAELGLKRIPRIVKTSLVSTPALFGLFRGVLLFPRGIHPQLNPAELRMVLLHELAHLRRYDVAVNTLTLCLQIVHWFNPLLWLAFSRLRHDRELATDALVLSGGREAERLLYGQTLLRLLETGPTMSRQGIGMVDNTRNLKERLTQIRRAGLGGARGTIVGTCLGMALLLLFGMTALTREPQAAVQPVEPAKPTELKPPQQRAPRMDDTGLYLQGTRLTAQEAASLEAEIAKAPDTETSEVARKKLLGYYTRKDKEAAKTHILWFIEHRPEAPSPEAQIDKILHPVIYAEISAAWEAQLRRAPENPRIIANMAAFYLIHDRKRAEELLRQGRALEPDNMKWVEQLALFMRLQQQRLSGKPAQDQARKELELRREVLAKVKGEEYFYYLGDAAHAALAAGETSAARAYAEELLQMAPDYKLNWNYGNAIYNGHSILGLIALREGNQAEAARELLAAGKTPGSPQLNSFGPDLTLATLLAQKGETEVVLSFLDDIARFWTNRQRIEAFRATVGKQKPVSPTP